jgi:TPR repeat protein
MKSPALVAAALTALFLCGGAAAARADLLDESRAAFEAGHEEQAFKLLTQAAEKGDAKAQYRLGLVYEHGRAGREGTKDDKKAAEWYAKSAAQGNPKAANNLGTLYRLGLGVERSDAEAFQWYLKASQARPNENAETDREDDREEGAVWTNLGGMYHWGRGTAKDEGKARDAYLKAAKLGDPYAQNNLAYMLERGLGGPKDAPGAADWYRKAAENGLHVAQGNLALIYETGRGVPRDEGEARGWYRKAALQGDAFAQYRLGRACERGRGEPKDLIEAYKWYLLSSQHGDRRAAAAAARLKPVLTPAQLDEAKARAAAAAKAAPHD